MQSQATLSRVRRFVSVLGVSAVLLAGGMIALRAKAAEGPAVPEPPATGEPTPTPPATGEPTPPAATAPELPDEEAELNKEKVLDDMYERLHAAPDEESAEVIAEAIEKLWLKSGSDTIDLLMGRALQMVQEERYDVALKLLDAVVALDPAYSEGWNQRATVNFLKRDYGSSLEDLRHVLSIDPRHFKAISGLALIMQELGQKESALKVFRKALAVHPFLDGAKQAVQELTREVEGQGI